ncbi:MAG: ABC transporter ATP-binding protein [Deltaproteobacteria bacterium]|nr:ABC transporter ATP-binding protein [Deltaproteobacteria bacterium]MBI3076686.1 ABC transporter ATP-binding protein [Deltaproteobacteria bacterium]
MIRINGLWKTYRSEAGEDIEALREITLRVDENEFITVVGPSGCGKSTLLKLIVGLIPATRGSIHFRDQLVTEPIQDVGMVFQSPVLLPWRSVLDNVLLPIEVMNRSRREHAPAALELIDLVGLSGFENKMPRELSGGMQQRASICRALITNPSLLLMDEPFGALDAMTREELGVELMRIWDEKRKTVVFVTHSIPEAVLLADRVVVFTARPGRVAEIIEVKLPRPRGLETEFAAEFKEYVDRIRAIIYAQKVRR